MGNVEIGSYLYLVARCPGSSRTGLILSVARTGHGWDMEIILQCLTSLLGTRGKKSLPGKMGSLQLSKVTEGTAR